jgi:D-glycerate 3-kinase
MFGNQQRLEFLLNQLISICNQEQTLDPGLVDELADLLLTDKSAARAFDVNAENSNEVTWERSHFLQSIYPKLWEFCSNTLRWQTCPLPTVWNLWLPLAVQLAEERQKLNRPLIQGILGGQGTGKTTLAAILKLILEHLGYQVCQLSLDDLYMTYMERLQMQQADPRLRWRGPPGTHDVELGVQVLQQLRQAGHQPIAIPRFDKSARYGAGDRTTPEVVIDVDILLFEGWFVGVRPIDPIAFDTSPPPIVTDADRVFACDINARLQDYVPLWDQLDRLLVLYPSDYRLSQEWRRQAEQQMIATGRTGMSDDEINQFVEYFWRSLHPDLFIKPLLHDCNHVNLVIEINPDHSPYALYCPGNANAG